MQEEFCRSRVTTGLDLRGFTNMAKEPGLLMDAWKRKIKMRLKSIRLFLAMPQSKRLCSIQNGVNECISCMAERILREFYVCQPLGFEDSEFPDIVYKVEKALYGLHQAPRACETTSTLWRFKAIAQNAEAKDVDCSFIDQ
ncbi:retrovirus-related pol polyprotein from transposon TNT 1-94 [Tanacetum coccineum]